MLVKPSPKFHCHEVGLPVDVSVNATDCPAAGDTGLNANDAATTATTVTVRFVLVYVMPVDAKEAAIGAITHLLQIGFLNHHVYREFAMSEVAEAHEAVETGRAIGNVVVLID